MKRRSPQNDWGWSTKGLEPKGEAVEFVVHEDTFGHMEVVSVSGGNRYTIYRRSGETDAQLRERIKAIIAGKQWPDGVSSHRGSRQPNLQQVPRSARQQANWTIQSGAADMHTALAGIQQEPIRIEDIEAAVKKIREQGMKPIDYQVMEKLIATQLDSGQQLKESAKHYLDRMHTAKHTWRNEYLGTPHPQESDPLIEAAQRVRKERELPTRQQAQDHTQGKKEKP